MPDPKPGAGGVLVGVAGIGINPEDMLERNGDTKDRYRSAGCRFKSNGADVRADSRRSSRASDQAKNQTFTAATLKYGAVALCYRLRGYSESVTRVTTRAPVLNYSALVSFLRTSAHFSPYLCMFERFCEAVSLLLCRRDVPWRLLTRGELEHFRAAGAAKRWSRWAGG